MEGAGTPAERRAPEWVRRQLVDILRFWHPGARDRRHGGYVNQLLAGGTVYDGETRHLVASARFAVCYHWVLRGVEPADRRKQAYGHAFVVLAGAMGLQAGVPGAADVLADAVTVADERFFAGGDLAINTMSEDWSEVAPYRGQNANMHMCEAFIAAYEATGDLAYLARAYRIADALARTMATRIGGVVWENHHADWSVDWGGPERDRASLESPHGIVPGHQAEWGKLLGILARHHGAEWLLPQAVHLYGLASDLGWDAAAGGFHSGLARDRIRRRRGAVVLVAVGGDRRRGGPRRAHRQRGERGDRRKGDGLDPDYHPAGACDEVLRTLGALPARR